MTDKRRAILAVAAGSVAIFWPGSFIFGFPGVMAPHWKIMFNVGQGPLGNILFFILAAVGIFMFVVGRWQEKVGISRMIALGAVMCGLDSLLIAFAPNILVVYAWAFFMGASSCFVYIPALTSVQRWFPARRGLVTGIVNMTFAMSAAIMAPVFRWLLDALGYEAMILGIGAPGLVTGLIAARFTEPPRQAVQTTTPQSGNPVTEDGYSFTLADSIRTRSFWCLWLTWALQGAAGIAMVTLSVTYGLAKGFSVQSAVMILTAFNFTNGLSRLLSGYLSDIIGRTPTMSLTFFAAAGAYFLLPHASSLALMTMLAVIIGYAFGTLFAVSAPLAVDCFGIRHFGAIFGLVFTAYGFVAAPLGPSLSGYMLDFTNGDFGLVFRYLGVFCLLSGIAIRLVTPPKLPAQLR